MFKGFYKSNHAKAFDNFIKANALASEQQNYQQLITVKHYIGLLKNISGETEEALILFKENFKNIYLYNLKKTDHKQYLKSLYALADSYSRNLKLDSAKIFLKLGLKESNKNKYLYHYFLSGYGINSYLQKNYNMSLDSLKKSLLLYKNTSKKRNQAPVCIYLYYTYRDMGNEKLGLKYLFKIDSLYTKGDSSIIFHARTSYFLLNKYFESKNKSKKQLKYLNKFLATDSIIDHDFGKLEKQITKKYETPLLLQQKQKLIIKLLHNNKQRLIIIASLTTLSVFFLLGLLFVVIRNYRNKKRFKIILEHIEAKKDIVEKTIQKNIKNATSKKLPEELVKKILDKLKVFEDTNNFIDSKYTLSSLSKELNTNSAYLSRVINITKGVNFSTYLNNLKIEYVIKKLTNDELFRKRYNIKGIAKACGFSNTQSFSKAFYKNTGLHPSYFIKQLNNKSNSIN